MIKYADKFTGKTFTVANNKVTDEFGNVATIPATDWVEMQGSDIEVIEGVEVKNVGYCFKNEKGNYVDVAYGDRVKAHKIVAKAFGLKISKLGNMQKRVVVLGRLV